MSRVGKQPLKVQNGVKVEFKDGTLKLEGPKGKLSHKFPKGISFKNEANVITLDTDKSVPNARALHGLTRTIIGNMMYGVTQGFTREMEIVGVGYRAQTKGTTLNMSLGYSHAIDYKLPEGIQAKVDSNTKIILTGSDKILLGMVAAKIRSFKKPEPYQGKGIRYANEHIVRKQGKAAAGAK